MKVRITFEEQDVGGMFSSRKAFAAILEVDLSEEERHIYMHNEMDEFVVMPRDPSYGSTVDSSMDKDIFWLKGKHLRGTDVYRLGTIAAAKAYAENLKEHLKQFKLELDMCAALPEPMEFEI